MSNATTRRRRRRTTVLLAAVAAASVTALSACSSASTGSSGQPAAAAGATSPSTMTATPAQLKEIALKVMNSTDPSSLPPEVQTVFAAAATPLTAAQRQLLYKCLSNAVCETGQGTKTLALIDDQVAPFYSINEAEVDSQAIQSGQIKKIIHYASNLNLPQFLADFRLAIAQRVSLIVSVFGALGNQAGPVLAEAKAAGIPVVNSAVPLQPSVGSELAVQVSSPLCGMWKSAASALTEHEKALGNTHVTYALFTGPAGNSYAAAWQPCAQQYVNALGWSKVYTGYTQWTPQGNTQAVDALLASGKNPDVILYDSSPENMIDAYMAAKQKMPVIFNGGTSYIGAFKAYEAAKAAGLNPDIWGMSSQVWMTRIAVVTGLEVADGQKPSSNPLVYPLTAAPFSEFISGQNLNQNPFAIAGSMLAPQDEAAALQH